MASRRMFAVGVTSSDAFADMPLSTQALYFHLGMVTDDDGFVVSPKRTQRAIGASDDDLRILVSEGFVIPFPSGVIVITHHKLNNTLRNDRYKPTCCQLELSQLDVLPSGAYRLKTDKVLPAVDQEATKCLPGDDHMATSCLPNRTEPNPTEPSQDDGAGANAPVAYEVVRYLNERVGSSFKPGSKRTVNLIEKQVSEGYGFQDFQHVIDLKAEQWGPDPEMRRYLRPETLFGPKFESYVNEREAVTHDGYAEYNCDL